MGFFSNAYKWINDKAKKVANFHDIAEKAKRGWNVGTQILGKARTILPKLKRVLEVASLIPVVGEYTAPLLAGVETADIALQTIDKYKGKAQKGYSKAKSGWGKVGAYAQELDEGNFSQKLKTAERVIGKGIGIYNQYNQNPASFFN